MARILLVEDDAEVRNFVAEVLAARGHYVECADSAEQAIPLYTQTGLFDLVLSDVVMPGIDGHEFVRRLSALHPATRVILMSGYDPGCEICPYVRRCPFLAKPFTVKALLDAVNNCLLLEPPRHRNPPTQ